MMLKSSYINSSSYESVGDDANMERNAAVREWKSALEMPADKEEEAAEEMPPWASANGTWATADGAWATADGAWAAANGAWAAVDEAWATANGAWITAGINGACIADPSWIAA